MLAIGLASLTWFSPGGAAGLEDGIAIANDLAQEAALAKTRQVPLLILFTSPNCMYCERVKQEFLIPMQRNPEYANKVLMRQIEYRGSGKLVDFSGASTTPAQFSKLHKITLTPTVKLFDSAGNSLSEPLVGLTTPDYYGAFLDRAIDEALAKTRHPSR